MAFELRVPDRDEFVAFVLPTLRAFGVPEPNEEELDDQTLVWEPDRSVGALDDGEWIGGTGAYSFDLTLPGGTTLPAAGVTMVGVSATHRRRGVLRQLMERQLDDVVDRDEPLAILTASESSIYGRFGYGLVGQPRGARDRRHPVGVPGRSRTVAHRAGTRLLSPRRRRRTAPGRLRAVPPAPGRPITRTPRPGSCASATGSAGGTARARCSSRSTRTATASPTASPPTGSRSDWTDSGLPQDKVVVDDLCGTTVGGRGGRCGGCCSTSTSPRRWSPTSARSTTRSSGGWPSRGGPRRTWSRTGCGCGCSTSRGRSRVAATRSPASSSSTSTIRSGRRTGGRFLVDVDPKSATCTRTDAEPDLAMEIDDLGAIYLGGVAPSMLAAAGRIKARSAEVLARADDLFRTTPGPFCMTGF